ncbi:hypothetical protein FALBO_7923 [Fusarium albosuccineum]|uniref:Uncharacterized protein n=1 Tax=Fusarium albosuccineum TaxID=1237068 RepID=A0A8H4LAG4_9HYPO|nr:hypothetical protein FALBO_7923 [Fusarium albosuccineum]
MPVRHARNPKQLAARFWIVAEGICIDPFPAAAVVGCCSQRTIDSVGGAQDASGVGLIKISNQYWAHHQPTPPTSIQRLHRHGDSSAKFHSSASKLPALPARAAPEQPICHRCIKLISLTHFHHRPGDLAAQHRPFPIRDNSPAFPINSQIVHSQPRPAPCNVRLIPASPDSCALVQRVVDPVPRFIKWLDRVPPLFLFGSRYYLSTSYVTFLPPKLPHQSSLVPVLKQPNSEKRDPLSPLVRTLPSVPSFSPHRPALVLTSCRLHSALSTACSAFALCLVSHPCSTSSRTIPVLQVQTLTLFRRSPPSSTYHLRDTY